MAPEAAATVENWGKASENTSPVIQPHRLSKQQAKKNPAQQSRAIIIHEDADLLVHELSINY